MSLAAVAVLAVTMGILGAMAGGLGRGDPGDDSPAVSATVVPSAVTPPPQTPAPEPADGDGDGGGNAKPDDKPAKPDKPDKPGKGNGNGGD